MAIGGSKQNIAGGCSRDDWKSGREELEILQSPRSLLQEIASEPNCPPIHMYVSDCEFIKIKIMTILII